MLFMCVVHVVSVWPCACACMRDRQSKCTCEPQPFIRLLCARAFAAPGCHAHSPAAAMLRRLSHLPARSQPSGVSIGHNLTWKTCAADASEVVPDIKISWLKKFDGDDMFKARVVNQSQLGFSWDTAQVGAGGVGGGGGGTLAAALRRAGAV